MHRRQILGLGVGGAVAVIGAGVIGWRSGPSMADYEALAAGQRVAAGPDIGDLIRVATLAPNGHNTQPWRFSAGDGRITIRPDFSRRTAVVDPDDHHLYVSLGAAAETLAVAAEATGRPGTLAFDPAGDGTILFDFAAGPPRPSPLADAIAIRKTTRADFDGRPASAEVLSALAASASIEGVDLVLVTEPERIAAVTELIIAGNTVQMDDAAFRSELKHWIRFDPRQAIQHRDGLFGPSSGNPSVPAWLGPLLFDLVLRTGPENARYRSQLATSSGLAIFVSQQDDRAHWVAAGRACQRFLLQATALGLQQSFVNQAVEVPAIRRELATLLGLGTAQRPDLIIRFGYPRADGRSGLPASLRRPVEAVIDSA